MQQQNVSSSSSNTLVPLSNNAASTSVVRPLRPNGGAAPTSLDFRAEEEAARRLNVGRAVVSGGRGGVSKESDLFGKGAVRTQLASIAREHGVSFDEEALSYLALAAETRLRSLLTSTIAAQLHRTTSTHARIPPLSKSRKPMWSHEILSDSNAILEAMNRANKDAEQTFRASRMDRLARETELQRAREKAERKDEDVSSDTAGPSTPAKPVGGSTSTPSGSGVGGGAAPVFGAVSEKKTSGPRKGRKGARDVSAEVAQKSTNATAMMNAGAFNRKYAWLNSVPNVSSPLAGRKRKSDKDGDDVEDGAGEDDSTDTKHGVKDKIKGKSKRSGTVVGAGEGDTTAGGGGLDRPRKVKRPKLTIPSRREVLVSRDGGVEKRISDDRAVTMMDMLFALEKEGVGMGMGENDEIVRKAWLLGGTPGGLGQTRR